MSEGKQHIKEEAITENTGRMRVLSSVLNGSFLTREGILKQLPYVLFVAFLLVLYIWNGYHAEKTVRELYKTDLQLKELKSEYTTTFSKLEILRQQSKVAEKIKAVGLEESRVPPKKIVINKK
jgi:hypothetical protein